MNIQNVFSHCGKQQVFNFILSSLLILLAIRTLIVIVQPDYTQNYIAARAWMKGLDPNAPLKELQPLCCADQKLPPTNLEQTAHPPLSTLVVLPWALFSWEISRWLWMVFGCIMMLWAWYYAQVPSLLRLVTMSFGLLALGLGSFEPILFACIVFSLVQLDKKPTLAGIALGFAIALKTYPIVLLAGLVVTKRWRSTISTIISAGFFTLLAELILGFGVTAAWLAFLPINAEAQADLVWNLSIVRLIRTIWPQISPTLIFLGLGAFFGGLLLPHLKQFRDIRVLLPVMLMTSPISWAQYFLFLALVPKIPKPLLILIVISAIAIYDLYTVVRESFNPIIFIPLLITTLCLWYLDVRAGIRKHK